MNDIEDLVRDGLRSSIADVRLTEDLLAAAAHRNRRRTVARTIGTATASVAAAAVLATVVAGTPTASTTQHTSSGTGRPSTAVGEQTVALVTARIAAAPVPRDAIEQTTSTVPAGVDGNASASREVGWYDLRADRGTSYSRLQNGALDEGINYPIGEAGGKFTVVNYPKRTYYVSHQKGGKLWWTHPYGKAGEPLIDDPDEIKAAVQRSDVSIVGKGTYGGRPAVHLRFSFTAKDGDVIRGDAWFDSETYVPLRARAEYPGLVTEVRYLPRTRENVARAKLVVPAGFSRVAAPSK